MTILCIIGAIASMMFATAYGEILLDIVDTFMNQVAAVFGIIIECIVFAWIFKAEELVDLLNSHSKTIKIGPKWLLIVKYLLPILLSIIWLGGVYNLINTETSDSLIIMSTLGAVLILSTLILTRLPPKNPEWEKSEQRN
jgi:NSS family neurotransmitter:Na+ symporter